MVRYIEACISCFCIQSESDESVPVSKSSGRETPSIVYHAFDRISSKRTRISSKTLPIQKSTTTLISSSIFFAHTLSISAKVRKGIISVIKKIILCYYGDRYKKSNSSDDASMT